MIPMSRMNSKSIALTITFTAVAITLNAVRIPAVFYPGNYYQISQIPIVLAFLLFGVKIGVLVGALNVAGGLALYHLGPNSIIVYPMDFVSLLVMFAGLLVAGKWVKSDNESGKAPFWRKSVVSLTSLAILFRGGIMPFVDYGVIRHVLAPLVLGFNLPEASATALIPIFVLYNVIVTLYTVPIAYVIAIRICKSLKIEPCLFSSTS